MSLLAGFAEALTIPEKTFQNLLQVFYLTGVLPHKMNGTGWNGFGWNFNLDMFQDVPIARFQRANGNRLMLILVAWGTIIVTPQSGIPETRRAILRAKVKTDFSVAFGTADDSSPTLNLDINGATADLIEVAIYPYAGGAFRRGGFASRI